MKKLYVTMMFVVDVPDEADLDVFKGVINGWCRNDPAGFLLSRPTVAERLPIQVSVVSAPHFAEVPAAQPTKLIGTLRTPDDGS